MSAARCNERYLPDIVFPDNLVLEPDLDRCLNGVHDVLIAVPSHGLRDILNQIGSLLDDKARVCWATKGFDPSSHELLSSVAAQRLPSCDMAAVSGPTFANEVARGLPTAITVASNNPMHAERVASYLHGENFRA